MHCILHIGTTKTATTLLQRWLYENETNLSRQGVALTRSVHFPNNRKLPAYFSGDVDNFLRRRDVTSCGGRNAYFAGLPADLAAEIAEKERGHHTVLFTSEHFHSLLDTQDLVTAVRDMLGGMVTSFRIVCYFREQSRLRTSLYSTALRNGFAGPAESFQSRASPDGHYYNYLVFFSKWENAFGQDALCPRLFDPERFVGGDIRRDFLAAALPAVDADALGFETTQANEALSSSLARVFQVINGHRRPFIAERADPTPSALKNIATALVGLNKADPISDTRQAEFYARCHDSNVAFFQRFFGVEENLFPEPALGMPADIKAPQDEPPEARFFDAVARKKNLIAMRRTEVDLLGDLAQRLLGDGAISRGEARAILDIALRARPGNKKLKALMEDLVDTET